MLKLFLMEYILVYGTCLIVILNIFKREPTLTNGRKPLFRMYLEQWYGYMSIFLLAYMTSVTVNITEHSGFTRSNMIELSSCVILLAVIHSILVFTPGLGLTKWVSTPFLDWTKAQEDVDLIMDTNINKVKLNNMIRIMVVVNLTFFIFLYNYETLL